MDSPIRGNSPALGPLFDKLESGFREVSDGYGFCAEIGGKRLKLSFTSREQAGIIEQYLAGLRIPETQSLDAHFCFWADDCSRYIASEALSKRWRYRDGNGCAMFVPGEWLIGTDVSVRTFCCCQHDPEKRARIHYWMLNVLISQWAGTAGLLPVHGAAVGVGGRGVLLAARSGSGKSTLAASCLLSGMDYVADDYVLVSEEGSPRAMPVSSALNMNPDMKGRLGLALPVISTNVNRGGKQMMDASSFPICREMVVCAVVFLSQWDQERAEISPASGHPALRLAQSAPRLEGAYDPYIAKAVVQRLSKLPAYEMRLGKNLEQNANVLHTWIERMK